MEQLQNGKIESTMLGREDHGIMTFMLQIDYGGSGQGVGGYGVAIISRILEVVDVMTWEELPGKHIRVIKQDSPYQARVIGIQNICTDARIIFQELADEYAAEPKGD